MKKTVFMAALLAIAFAALIGSCASTGGYAIGQIIEAAAYFNEGDYYAWRFETFKAQALRGIGGQQRAADQPVQTTTTQEGIGGQQRAADQSQSENYVPQGRGEIHAITGIGGGERNSGGKESTTTDRRYGENPRIEILSGPGRGVPSFTSGRRVIGYDRSSERISSEEYIDLAIKSYEASLSIIPSGTWKIPQKIDVNEARRFPLAFRLPPEEGVQARLKEAQKSKQEWLAKKEEFNLSIEYQN